MIITVPLARAVAVGPARLPPGRYAVLLLAPGEVCSDGSCVVLANGGEVTVVTRSGVIECTAPCIIEKKRVVKLIMEGNPVLATVKARIASLDPLAAIAAAVASILNGLAAAVSQFASTIAQLVAPIAGAIMSLADTVVRVLTSAAKAVVEAINAVIGSVYENIVKPVLYAILSVLRVIADFVANTLKETFNIIVGVARAVAATVLSIISGAAMMVAQALGYLGHAMAAAAKMVKSLALELIGSAEDDARSAKEEAEKVKAVATNDDVRRAADNVIRSADAVLKGAEDVKVKVVKIGAAEEGGRTSMGLAVGAAAALIVGAGLFLAMRGGRHWHGA